MIPTKHRFSSAVFASLLLVTCAASGNCQQPFDPSLFAKKNLVAWCIVPFDSKKRTSEERAAMLDELGIKKLAYDYRAEHVASFETEIETMKRHGIEFTAWWFPTDLNDEAKLILRLIEKHGIHPQLWVMGGGDPKMTKEDEQRFIESEVRRIGEIAKAAKQVGCKVGLYNHGGWFGEPENQVKLIKALAMDNVGIVYNLHHAHDQLDRLENILQLIKPYALAININGTQTDGERVGKKILPVHDGDRDQEVIRLIGKCGYQGPIGILNHTDLDARERLFANLDGLQRVVREINGDQK